MAGFTFIHCSDLHIGRRFRAFSLLEDQRHVLGQIVDLAETHDVDAVLIAGDFYDSAIPSAEAVSLADQFLADLVKICPVLLIAGNHDSAERLHFGSRLLAASHVHIAALPAATPYSVSFQDEYGPLDVDMLPFVRASSVRRFYENERIETCEDAVRTVLSQAPSPMVSRRIAMAHQFVKGGTLRPLESESEISWVGTTGEVDAAVFAGYHYVALGHLHAAQTIGAEHIRYSGSPLKYSMSEVNHQKGVNLVTMGKDAVASVEVLPLVPLRDLVELECTFAEALSMGAAWSAACDPRAEAFVFFTLLDEVFPSDAMHRLRSYFPQVIGLSLKKQYEASSPHLLCTREEKDPLLQFQTFFAKQMEQPLSRQQEKWLQEALQKVREEA